MSDFGRTRVFVNGWTKAIALGLTLLLALGAGVYSFGIQSGAVRALERETAVLQNGLGELDMEVDARGECLSRLSEAIVSLKHAVTSLQREVWELNKRLAEGAP